MLARNTALNAILFSFGLEKTGFTATTLTVAVSIYELIMQGTEYTLWLY